MNDRSDSTFDLDELLHPANAFGHPSEVVNDPDLTLNEKRAILASWGVGCLCHRGGARATGRSARHPRAFRRHHGSVADTRPTGERRRKRQAPARAASLAHFPAQWP
jgi:hypothetical protein